MPATGDQYLMSIKCIYCQEVKSDDCYNKTEHVMPQSFGVFRDNFTLNKVVCDDCNQYFGDKLEIDLARDTFEGLQRFNFDVKKPAEYKTFGQGSRMVIRIADPPFKGVFAYREYSPENDRIELRPIAQVGFKRQDSLDYEYFLINNIPDRKYLEKNNFDLKHSEAIRAFGIEENLLKQELAKRNITFKTGGEIIPPDNSDDLLCEIEGEIDKTIYRAVAKIGFNYLAKWQGEEFLNLPSFDFARKFIRYGETAPYPLVRATENPILADEPVEGQRRVGHLVTVNWAADNLSIVSQVSLFNWATYCVSLAREFTGEHKEIRKGHFFNTNSHEILDLIHFRISIH